ncbi:hypothetical protein K8I28_07640 [bacterium]|nr:hypothetical protein [bacterium]
MTRKRTTNSNGFTPSKVNGDKGSAIISEDELSSLQGLDLDTEVAIMTENLQPVFPRVRIDHSPSGRHRMFLDLGESYSDDQEAQVDLEGNTFAGIVVYHQKVSAFWVEGEQVPRYTAVDGRVTSSPESTIHAKDAKDKIRLFVLTNMDDRYQLIVFNLSPTSIKHWRNHVARLARSKAPSIAVVTRFTLADVARNGFRWAEVECKVDRVVSQDELNLAMQVREECKAVFGVGITESDFDDPGDRKQKQQGEAA